MDSRFELKAAPDDFVVTEVALVPLLIDRGRATHTYVWLKKRGLTTFVAIDVVAAHFGLEREQVRAQGLKDEDGMAGQMLSVERILDTRAVAAFNEVHARRPASLEIERIEGYGVSAVTPKRLHGNTFDLVVRDLHDETAERLATLARDRTPFTMINYYDVQRFGIAGHPRLAHLIGEKLIARAWIEALQLYVRSGNEPRYEADAAAATEDDAVSFFRREARHLASFFVSARNSQEWNREASRLLAELNPRGLRELSLEGVGALNVPAGPGFVVADQCRSEAYELKLDPPRWERRTKTRALAVGTSIHLHAIGDDERHLGRKKLRLAFFLPSGSYATMLVKQLVARS